MNVSLSGWVSCVKNTHVLTHVTATVRDVVEKARVAYGRGEVQYASKDEGPHEARWLTLETAKARTALGVSPKWGLSETVTRTVEWHRNLEDGGHARDLCLAEINDYHTALTDEANP